MLVATKVAQLVEAGNVLRFNFVSSCVRESYLLVKEGKILLIAY